MLDDFKLNIPEIDQINKEQSILSKSEGIDWYKFDPQENIYYNLVKIEDLAKGMEYKVLFKSICEMLLRQHTKIKKIYDRYASREEKRHEEGYFMTFKSFIDFLIDCRLINGRLSIMRITNISRSEFFEREIDLHYDRTNAENIIGYIEKCYNIQYANEISEDYSDLSYGSGSKLDSQDDESIISTILVEKYARELSERNNYRFRIDYNRLVFFRTFVNLFVRNIISDQRVNYAAVWILLLNCRNCSESNI